MHVVIMSRCIYGSIYLYTKYNTHDDDDDDEYDNFYGAITQHMPLQERLDKKAHRLSEI